jgi:hypothetical protein
MNMKIFSVSCPDNDSYMCASTDHVHVDGVPTCVSCGYKTDPYFINPLFRVKRRTYDLSSTYDGYDIASLKFVEACNRNHLAGLSFLPLPSDDGFFAIRPESFVKFDAEARKTRFEGLCSTCGGYKSVAGAHPVFLLERPSTDLSATDQLFGSGNCRSRVILSTDRAKGILSRERLAGLRYEATMGAA